MMNPKWPISNLNRLSIEERQSYWEKVHRDDAYRPVWSVTDALDVRHKIVDEVSKRKNIKNLLVPGCGSKVLLQNDIARRCPSVDEILCTDFPEVVELASQQENHPKIRYLAADHANLGMDSDWDAIVVVNSILSEDDEENRAMIGSCCRALRSGGWLLGFFPTIYSSLDIAYLDDPEKWLDRIDLRRSAFFEEKQGLWQLFYTPLRLRMMLKHAELRIKTFEIYFFDSDHFLRESEAYYGLSDKDLVVYELFVVARKPFAGTEPI